MRIQTLNRDYEILRIAESGERMDVLIARDEKHPEEGKCMLVILKQETDIHRFLPFLAAQQENDLQSFYRFWPVLAALTGEPVPAREDIEAKKQIILRHGLALWDTLERCTITGAADASIKDAVPNDIAALLAKAPIEAVFCNGATAFRIYTKYLQPVSGIAAVKLPSTSPANAACRPEKLREIWGAALLPWINK